MVKPYDLAVRDLIKIFAPGILVIGLQNDDNDLSSVMTQAGSKSGDESKIPFPIISVFRNPEIEITDGSVTKRAGTSDGYRDIDEENYLANKLIFMRSTLTYTVDVFDTTRASAEEVATKLYFRLRNNPEIRATFVFPDFENTSYECAAEIELDSAITNVRTNDLDNIQLYKVRFTFKLVNANLLDIISKELPREIRWTVTAELE